MIAIHSSTGCYALDALGRPELTEFEAHLARCYSCRQEVADFHETAAELTLLTQATPPPALRDTVVSAARRTPQLPPSASVDSLAGDEPVLRRQWPQNPGGLVAAMLAVIVGLGGVVYSLLQERKSESPSIAAD